MADRVAFKAVYIPILRQEMLEFVLNWNNHTIRKQPKRPYLIPGVPHLLYHYPEQKGGVQCGVPVTIDQTAPFAAQLATFGTFLYHARSSEFCSQCGS
jgi:hypothetical protein